MKTLATLAVLICCLLMFVVKREYKIGILFLSCMLFTAVRVTFLPFLQSARLLIVLSFLVSEMPHIKQLIIHSQRTIVWRLMGLSLVIAFVTILFSPHLHSANNIRMFVQDGLFLKDFALIYGFWCITDEISIKPTLKITFWGLIALTFFGIMNYITKQADVVSSLAAGLKSTGIGGLSGVDVGSAFTYEDRFRVQAMFMNPFDYGYICSMTLLLHLYGLSKSFESKSIFKIVALCTLFGIITCGARTVLFCSIIGISVFCLFAFKSKKTIQIGLVFILLIPIAYQTIPPVQEQIDKMLTMFDKNSNVSGSSLEMRALQYAAVIYYIQDSPWFGRGYGFFNIDLGWAQGRQYLVDKDLQGLEGVVMNKLLERGFIGLALYLSFWISLVIYMFRNRKTSKQVTALGLSILAVYLLFANMTGDLLSVYPSLLLLGFSVEAIEWKKVKSTPPEEVWVSINKLVLLPIPCKTLKLARI